MEMLEIHDLGSILTGLSHEHNGTNKLPIFNTYVDFLIENRRKYKNTIHVCHNTNSSHVLK